MFKNDLASKIEQMAPGSRVIIDGVEYLRVADIPETHIYDKIVSLDNGRLYSWYSLCYSNDIVTFVLED